MDYHFFRSFSHYLRGEKFDDQNDVKMDILIEFRPGTHAFFLILVAAVHVYFYAVFFFSSCSALSHFALFLAISGKSVSSSDPS